MFLEKLVNMADNDDLLDYEDEEQPEQVVVESNADGTQKKEVKGTYVSIHSSGFRDFLLKPEILRAIVDCGFEHPSEGKFLISFHWAGCGFICILRNFLFSCFILCNFKKECTKSGFFVWKTKV